MRVGKVVVMAGVLMTATVAMGQESGIHVRSIRVLATDPEAVATFYKRAFGMSETRRPVDSETFKEIVINSGSTPDVARHATTTAIVIATRPPETPAGGMAALILQVPDLDAAIESVQASGGTLMRPATDFGDLQFAFVQDPDGNQIELIMSQPATTR